MNKKAFELAISTLVIIIIGILVMIGLIYALNGGFQNLRSTTDPFTDTATATAVSQSCKNACEQNSKIIYCCAEYKIDGRSVNCTDSRLDLGGCILDCKSAQCN